MDLSYFKLFNYCCVIRTSVLSFPRKLLEKLYIVYQVVKHTDYKTRLEFDMAVHERLVAAGVEIVCLAGFMRVLTGEFVKLWRGRLINIHPALLPLFKGTHAHRQALEAGVRITGCTAHFVEVSVYKLMCLSLYSFLTTFRYVFYFICPVSS